MRRYYLIDSERYAEQNKLRAILMKLNHLVISLMVMLAVYSVPVAQAGDTITNSFTTFAASENRGYGEASINLLPLFLGYFEGVFTGKVNDFVGGRIRVLAGSSRPGQSDYRTAREEGIGIVLSLPVSQTHSVYIASERTSYESRYRFDGGRPDETYRGSGYAVAYGLRYKAYRKESPSWTFEYGTVNQEQYDVVLTDGRVLKSGSTGIFAIRVGVVF